MDFEKALEEIIECGKEETAEQWLDKIYGEYGVVPLIFQRMAKRPEILLSHLLYKSTIAETSSIDPKYVELISLAVSAALNCKHCVEHHYRGALTKGATRDEILETILLAGSLAQASVLADAYRIIDTDENSCDDGSCDTNGFQLTDILKK